MNRNWWFICESMNAVRADQKGERPFNSGPFSLSLPVGCYESTMANPVGVFQSPASQMLGRQPFPGLMLQWSMSRPEKRLAFWNRLERILRWTADQRGAPFSSPISATMFDRIFIALVAATAFFATSAGLHSNVSNAPFSFWYRVNMKWTLSRMKAQEPHCLAISMPYLTRPSVRRSGKYWPLRENHTRVSPMPPHLAKNPFWTSQVP